MVFYATFGQASPQKNRFVKLIASSYEIARLAMTKRYDHAWSMLYEEEEFPESDRKMYCKEGILEEIVCE